MVFTFITFMTLFAFAAHENNHAKESWLKAKKATVISCGAVNEKGLKYTRSNDISEEKFCIAHNEEKKKNQDNGNGCSHQLSCNTVFNATCNKRRNAAYKIV